MKNCKSVLPLVIALLAAFFVASPALAAATPSGAVTKALEEVAGEGRPLSLSLQILILMSLLTVLPSLILMMTSFTRIIIVLSILRQALGLQQTPPNQVLVGLALFLSLFVMAPTISTINEKAIEPYGQDEITIETAIEVSGTVFHDFMIKQTGNPISSCSWTSRRNRPWKTPRMCRFRSCSPPMSPVNSKPRFRSVFSFSCRSW